MHSPNCVNAGGMVGYSLFDTISDCQNIGDKDLDLVVGNGKKKKKIKFDKKTILK